MPKIPRNIYGRKPERGGDGGYLEVTPTIRRFVEADGSDVRLNRVRRFNAAGIFQGSYLLDPMGRRFVDNLENTEDDPAYVATLTDD